MLAVGLGAARAALGAGALLATRPTLRALLFGHTDEVGETLAKLAGGRDLALGGLTLAAARDQRELRRLTLLAAALDAADAVSMALASRGSRRPVAQVGGVLSGGAASVAGIWAGRRLAR